MSLFRRRRRTTKLTAPARPSLTGIDRDHRMFRICDVCQQPLGTEPQPGYPTPQRCACDRPADEPVWPGFDYNEHLHLCMCCRGVALPSGSRWSVWFCRPCRDRVRLYNDRLGHVVIPIGRHSLMAGIGIRGVELSEADGAEVDRLVARFVGRSFGLFSPMDRLWDVAERRSIAMRPALDYGRHDRPRLDQWLARARDAGTRDPRFGMDAAFGFLVEGMTEIAG